MRVPTCPRLPHSHLGVHAVARRAVRLTTQEAIMEHSLPPVSAQILARHICLAELSSTNVVGRDTSIGLQCAPITGLRGVRRILGCLIESSGLSHILLQIRWNPAFCQRPPLPHFRDSMEWRRHMNVSPEAGAKSTKIATSKSFFRQPMREVSP